jgi:polyisoprenoid-binding protein YceI
MSTVTETTTSWNVDAAHSNAEFSVRHLMISTVKGRFAEVGGKVVTDEANPAKSQVEVTLGVASIDTREAQRDAHLKSGDFFDAEKFPTITFRSTRVEGALNGTFKLAGDLTIRGVSREVVLDVTSEGRGKDPWGGERAGFSATAKIKRSDFGLTWNQLLETGGVAVGDEIKISIDVELVKQA